MKTRVMYMHTLNGRPASYYDYHGPALFTAGTGHRSRAAMLVASLDQIRRERSACLLEDLRYYEKHGGVPPNPAQYGYVLVKVPA